MIGWLITLGYMMMVFGATRVISNRYIDKMVEAKESKCCRDRYGSVYHMAGCPARWGRPSIIGVAATCSLLWPLALPLFFIAAKPTKGEKAVVAKKREEEDRKELERLRQKYDL